MELQPALQSERLRLRPIAQGDFDSLFAVASDPLIWELHPERERYKREVFEKFFRQALEMKALAIEDIASGEVIGSSRFYSDDSNQNEREPRYANESRIAIGYTFLARKYWGGSWNGELKLLMTGYAFQFVDACVFHVGEENWRSQKAVEKIGARRTAEINNMTSSRLVFRLGKGEFRIPRGA